MLLCHGIESLVPENRKPCITDSVSDHGPPGSVLSGGYVFSNAASKLSVVRIVRLGHCQGSLGLQRVEVAATKRILRVGWVFQA